MGRDLEKELQNWDGEWPEAWRPKENEAPLVGKVLRYGEGQSAYGVVRTAIVQRKDGSRVSVWLSSTVLLAEFQRLKPKVGEEVGIRYLGKHPEKNYKRYAVLVNRDEPQEPTFEPLGGERGGDPDQDPFAEFDEEPPLEAPPAYAREVLQPGGRRRWN